MEVILRRIKKTQNSETWSSTDECFDLSDQKSYTVGRKRDNDIILRTTAVSRNHCIFHHRTDGLFVEGLNSPSNMSINSNCPEKGVLVKLNNDDIIKIGCLYTFQVKFKLLIPPASIKSEAFAFVSTGNEESSATSSDTNDNLPHISLPSASGVKREPGEDFSSTPPPSKAAKIIKSETFSQALARVSMEGDAQTQSSLQPEADSDLNSLALDLPPESSPVISYEMQFQIEDQDMKPLDLRCKTLNPSLSIESLAQNVTPESELNHTERVKIENPDIPVTNKTLFAKGTLEVLPGPSRVDDPVIEDPQNTIPEEETIPGSLAQNVTPESELNPLERVKVENPDIPTTNKTLFAKETPDVLPGPSHVDDTLNEEPQNIVPEEEAMPFVKIENPDIPATNKTLFAKETPDVLPGPSHVDDTSNKEPQNIVPEEEVMPYIKIENPDIPATNKTLFAKEIPEVLPSPSRVDDPVIEDPQNTVPEEETIPGSNQDYPQNLKFPSRAQTPDLDEGMQIEIDEMDLKPVLNSETHFDGASNSNRESETEKNDSTSGEEIRDKNYLDSVEARINSYLAIRVKSEFQNFGVTSGGQLNPVLDESNLPIKDQNESLVEPPTGTLIQTAIEAQGRVKSEPQNESGSVEPMRENQSQSSLEGQISSDLGIRVKSEEMNTLEPPEIEIIQFNPEEESLESRGHLEIDPPFDSSVEVAIIGERQKHKRRSRRERNSEISSFGVRIKEEPQEDDVDLNVSVKQEKSPDVHPWVQNSPPLVKEERSDQLLPNQLLSNQFLPNHSLPNQLLANEPTVISERLDSIVSYPGTLVDSIEFHEEKPALTNEDLDKSVEDNSTSLAEKSAEVENTDSLLSDKLKIKRELLRESSSSENSDVDSNCSTDTETLRTTRTEVAESVLEINKYLTDILETTPSLGKRDKEDRERRKELKKRTEVVSEEEQNVGSVSSKEKDKERKDEKSKQRDKEKGRKRDTKSKEVKSKEAKNKETKSKEVKNKETKSKETKSTDPVETKSKAKEKEKKSRQEDKSRKREEIEDQRKSEDSNRRKSHMEESEGMKKLSDEKQKETPKVDPKSKRPEPGNSKPENKVEKKNSTDDSEIRSYLGGSVLGNIEDMLRKEERRPLDRLHHQSRFKERGRESGDKGTEPGPKKKLNLSEYKERIAKIGAGSAPGPRVQQRESQVDAASTVPLHYPVPPHPRSVDSTNPSFRNLGMHQPALATSNFDPRISQYSHNIPFGNTGISQGPAQNSWSDVQFRGMENQTPAARSSDPRIQQMNRRLPRDQSSTSKGLENEVRGPVFPDPRTQQMAESFANNENSPRNKNTSYRGVEPEVYGSRSLDPRTQQSSRGLESGSSSSDPRHQASRDPRDTNFSLRGSYVEIAGSDSLDPRKAAKPRQPHNRDSVRNEIFSPNEVENKLRSSSHEVPRMERALEPGPQPSTSGSRSRKDRVNKSTKTPDMKPTEPDESSDLADHLLYEIFTWNPYVFLDTSRRSFLRNLQNIEPMSLTYRSYSHYVETIFNILCLKIASKIEIEIMIDQESSKFRQCTIQPDFIQKVRLKEANDSNAYLIPFLLKISVPILDVTIPHSGDLLQITVAFEDNKTLLVFGCIKKICSRGPSDGPRKLMTYLVTIKDDPRFDIRKSEIIEVRIIKNLSWEIKCASALLHLKDSPVLPSILQPDVHLSVQRPRNLLRNKVLVFQPNLDQDQLEAISLIMEAVASEKPRVCLIEGSIGTGKTELIYHTILNLLWKTNYQVEKKQEENKTNILVCTSSNVEFEEIVTKLIALDPPSVGINMVVVTSDEDETSARIEKFTLQHFVTSYVEKQKTKYHQTQCRKPLNLQAQIYKEGMEKLAKEFQLTQCKYTGLKMTVFKVFFQAVSNNKTVKDLAAHQMDELYDTGNLTYLMGANLIFCNIANLTNHPAMEQYRNHKTVSLCIVDEAAQITELEALKVLGFGAKTLVMLGNKDKKPNTKISEELWKFRVRNSLFSRLARKCLNDKRNPLVQLRTQHRFTRDLENWLIHGRFINIRTLSNAVELAVPFPLYPVKIFNLNYTEDFAENEACFASRVIQCIASFGDLRRMERKISVGVIISTIASKERVEQEIQNRLNEVPGGKAQIFNVETNIVEAFANREKDIILISCLRNRDLVHSEGFHRFYSGLTRAKHCLIIFGRFTLVSKVKRECEWHNLVDLYARDVVTISAHTEFTEYKRDLIR